MFQNILSLKLVSMKDADFPQFFNQTVGSFYVHFLNGKIGLSVQFDVVVNGMLIVEKYRRFCTLFFRMPYASYSVEVCQFGLDLKREWNMKLEYITGL